MRFTDVIFPFSDLISLILFGVLLALATPNTKPPIHTQYTEALQVVLRSGRIGKIVSVEHLEPVGHTHQAHSFVRGNWRNEEESSFMLLAKSCHDMD